MKQLIATLEKALLQATELQLDDSIIEQIELVIGEIEDL
jgi:hypothetical protein